MERVLQIVGAMRSAKVIGIVVLTTLTNASKSMGESEGLGEHRTHHTE